MATATKKKSSKSVKPGAKPQAADVTMSELSQLRGELVKAEAARKKLDVAWITPREKVAAAETVVAELRGKMEAAELKEMALPPATVAGLKFTERSLLIATIKRTGNHREAHDPASLERLGRTIKTVGLQQRIGVRDVGDGSFELIFGDRRLGAVERLAKEDPKWEEIPAKVYPQSLTAAQVEILRTIENFGRKELTAVERAIAVARTIEAIGKVLKPLQTRGKVIQLEDVPSDDWLERTKEFTAAFQPEKAFKGDPELIAAGNLAKEISAAGGRDAYVGQQLGFPARWVRDNAFVARLGGMARALLAAGRLDLGHGRELAKLGDNEQQDRIAEDVARNEKGLGGETVEHTRQMVIDSMRSLKVVPWKLEVAFGAGVPGCTGQACATCRFNSKAEPDLFDNSIADVPESGICTNETCFLAKEEIWEKEKPKFVVKAKAEVKKHHVDVTERGLASIIPIWAKPSTAVRAAKKAIEPAAKKDGGSAKPQAGGKETPEQVAARKFDEAMVAWGRETEQAIEAAAKTDPMKYAALVVATATHEIGDWGWGEEGEKKLKQHGHIVDMLVAVDLPRLAAVAAKAKYPNLNVIDRAPHVFLERIVAAWGVKAKAKPVIGDFLPKEKSAKPQAEEGSGCPVHAVPLTVGARVRTTCELHEPRTGRIAAIARNGLRGAIVNVSVEWDGAGKKKGKIEACAPEAIQVIEDGTKPQAAEAAAAPADQVDGEHPHEKGGALVPVGFERQKPVDAFYATADIIPIEIDESLAPADVRVEVVLGEDGYWYGTAQANQNFLPACDLPHSPRVDGESFTTRERCIVHYAGELLNWLGDRLNASPAVKGKAKKAIESLMESVEAFRDLRRCRCCGCTEDNCQNCIERTGHPCVWAEEDLCSACEGAPRLEELAPGNRETSLPGKKEKAKRQAAKKEAEYMEGDPFKLATARPRYEGTPLRFVFVEAGISASSIAAWLGSFKVNTLGELEDHLTYDQWAKGAAGVQKAFHSMSREMAEQVCFLVHGFFARGDHLKPVPKADDFDDSHAPAVAGVEG